MTIGKGTSWGSPRQLPAGSPVLDSDASLFHWLNSGSPVNSTDSTDALSDVGLTGGSLWSMLGGASCVGRITTSESVGYSCDVVDVRTDVGDFRFIASMAAHTLTWSRAVLAMNVQDFGRFRFGHRAHPGDGLVDIYQADLPMQQRFLVAKRARLGAHLPHPFIREQRVAHAELTLRRPMRFWLDGVACGRSASFALRVEPDALTVII